MSSAEHPLPFTDSSRCFGWVVSRVSGDATGYAAVCPSKGQRVGALRPLYVIRLCV